jgi:hypothetical protein
MGKLTIDECVENVLPVLLHQVVDVAKDSAGAWLSVLDLPCRCTAVGFAGQLSSTYHMAT